MSVHWWVWVLITVSVIALGWLAISRGWVDLSDKTRRKPSGHAAMLIGDEVFAPRKYEAQLEVERRSRLPQPIASPDGDKGIAFIDEEANDPRSIDRFRGTIRIDGLSR